MSNNRSPFCGKWVSHYFIQLLDLFYPRLCLACAAALPMGEEGICLFCRHKLPLTNYHLLAENPFAERFWGRLPLHSGTSLYHFNKGGRVQQLIHQLKYHHQPEIGVALGKLHGRHLKESALFSEVSLILPVPLHPRKRHQRGYNQCDHYARGLSETMDIPWSAAHLLRKQYTTTQTAKSRLERFGNVQAVFELQQLEELSNNANTGLNPGYQNKECSRHSTKNVFHQSVC